MSHSVPPLQREKNGFFEFLFFFTEENELFLPQHTYFCSMKVEESSIQISSGEWLKSKAAEMEPFKQTPGLTQLQYSLVSHLFLYFQIIF